LTEPTAESRKRVMIARLVGVGWFVGITIAGGAIGGLALDGWLGTKPVLTVVGVLLGLAVAVVGMYRMLAAVLQNPPRSDR
jgi:F0F1-type ATP synthase assembly protein I